MPTDAALEEVMDWLMARTWCAVSLQWNGGWWTNEVWETIDGRIQRNYPGGGPNALSAAVSTFQRIAGRTEPQLTGKQIDAQVQDWMQRHRLVWTEDGRIVEEGCDDE